MSGPETWALPYHRLPLDQAKKEVRIIEFHFEGGGEGFFERVIDMEAETKRPITLRMLKASLLEPPKFRALSYVWGPSRENRRITLQVPRKGEQDDSKSIEGAAAAAEEELLDSCEIEVTDNLFAALVEYRTMSSVDKPAYFWIDALCINQRDNVEKSWQVAMMGDVYRSAHLVMAWLGPYPEPVRFRPGELIKTLQELAAEGLYKFGPDIRHPLTVLRTGRTTSFMETDIVEWVRGVEVVKGPFSRRHSDGRYEISGWALQGMMTLPFWRRVWILQEVLLAQQILFTWAVWSIPSERLFIAMRIIDKALQVAGERGPLSSTPGIEDVLPSGKLWIRTSNAQETSTCPILARRHDGTNKNELWDLIHWNAVCGGLEASMPADHVYGLCGVATDVEELGIRPDYSRDVADIYTELTSSCIKQKGLEVISDVQWPKKVANLPSWVPDWSGLSSAPTRASIWGSHKQMLTILSASGNTCGYYAGPLNYNLTVSSAGLPALATGGCIVTTVRSFLPQMQTASGENTRLIRRIWNIQAKLAFAREIIENSATHTGLWKTAIRRLRVQLSLGGGRGADCVGRTNGL